MIAPDVIIRVNPALTADHLFTFYQRNDICEVGFGKETAAKILKHPHLIVAAFADDERSWQYQDRTITYSWIGMADVNASRVYALAITADRRLLLVSDGSGDSQFWLPGGGIENGETPTDALARELAEEAAATILDLQRLGAQQVDDPQKGTEYHDFYWCRVTLAEEFLPRHEVKLRRLVAPDDFLDTLFWGRDDPKAAMLLELALRIDELYPQQPTNATDNE